MAEEHDWKINGSKVDPKPAYQILEVVGQEMLCHFPYALGAGRLVVRRLC
jgi:hypothetical protein